MNEALNEVKAWITFKKSQGWTYRGLAKALGISRDKLWRIMRRAKSVDGQTYRRFKELE